MPLPLLFRRTQVLGNMQPTMYYRNHLDTWSVFLLINSSWYFWLRNTLTHNRLLSMKSVLFTVLCCLNCLNFVLFICHTWFIRLTGVGVFVCPGRWSVWWKPGTGHRALSYVRHLVSATPQFAGWSDDHNNKWPKTITTPKRERKWHCHQMYNDMLTHPVRRTGVIYDLCLMDLIISLRHLLLASQMCVKKSLEIIDCSCYFC